MSLKKKPGFVLSCWPWPLQPLSQPPQLFYIFQRAPAGRRQSLCPACWSDIPGSRCTCPTIWWTRTAGWCGKSRGTCRDRADRNARCWSMCSAPRRCGTLSDFLLCRRWFFYGSRRMSCGCSRSSSNSPPFSHGSVLAPKSSLKLILQVYSLSLPRIFVRWRFCSQYDGQLRRAGRVKRPVPVQSTAATASSARTAGSKGSWCTSPVALDWTWVAKYSKSMFLGLAWVLQVLRCRLCWGWFSSEFFVKFNCLV